MSGLVVSFEIFPPRNEAAWKTLRPAMERLAVYGPEFVSVTYGAGGSTKPASLETVGWLKRETALDVAGHLTCVDATREEVDAVIAAYHTLGIRRIVALRGDRPGGTGEPYAPHPLGYQSTAELVAAARAFGGIEVSVSAYPEKHPNSPDFATDLDVLAAKVEAGASHAMTQFFFDNESFYRYRDRVAARGIDVHLVPGILPIGSFTQVASFAALRDIFPRGCANASRASRTIPTRIGWSPRRSRPSRSTTWRRMASTSSISTRSTAPN